MLLRAYSETRNQRKLAEQSGLKVLPALVLSLTQHCNLSCTGCFAAASGITCQKNAQQPRAKKQQLDWNGWSKIISEARKLGVFGFFLAGGESFLFPRLVELCEQFRDRVFVIFTNGTAVSEKDFERLSRLCNVAVVVSVEGGEEDTNRRRGQGVYQKATSTLRRLTAIGTPNGISATITHLNYKYWMNSKNIDKLVVQGVRIAFLIEYIPVMQAPETELFGNRDFGEFDERALMLTEAQRRKFRIQILKHRKNNPLYIIHSPGDEEYFGGCVSAGRGFAHVTPAGDLTACPVSNVATHNLKTATLRDALASPLFTKIRENEHLLENDGTPCALFAHPKEVEELANSVEAYRTDQ